MFESPVMLLVDLMILVGWAPLLVIVLTACSDLGERFGIGSKLDSIMGFVMLVIVMIGGPSTLAFAGAATDWHGGAYASTLMMPLCSFVLWGIILAVPCVVKYFTELGEEVAKVHREHRATVEKKREVIEDERERRDAETGRLAVLREDDVAGRLSKTRESGRLSRISS